MERKVKLALGEEVTIMQTRPHFPVPERGRAIIGQPTFVAYLDVLGFRSRLFYDAALLYQDFRQATHLARKATMTKYEEIDEHQIPTAHGAVASTEKKAHRGKKGSTQGLDGPKRLRASTQFPHVNPPAVFSDSIFLTSVDNSESSLRELCHAVGLLFREYMKLKLPIRGAISGGKIWWNPRDGIYMGTGIAKAYELAESLEGIGVCVDPAVEDPLIMAGPCRFYLKGRGPVNLFAPLQSPFEPDDKAWYSFLELSGEARSSANLNLIYKYEVSAEVVSAMLGKAPQYLPGKRLA